MRVNQCRATRKQNFCLESFLFIQLSSVTSQLVSYYMLVGKIWELSKKFQLNKKKPHHERFRSERKKVLYDTFLLPQISCKVKHCKMQFQNIFTFVLVVGRNHLTVWWPIFLSFTKFFQTDCLHAICNLFKRLSPWGVVSNTILKISVF